MEDWLKCEISPLVKYGRNQSKRSQPSSTKPNHYRVIAFWLSKNNQVCYYGPHSLSCFSNIFYSDKEIHICFLVLYCPDDRNGELVITLCSLCFVAVLVKCANLMFSDNLTSPLLTRCVISPFSTKPKYQHTL